MEPCGPLDGDKLCSRQEAESAPGAESQVMREDARVPSEAGEVWEALSELGVVLVLFILCLFFFIL